MNGFILWVAQGFGAGRIPVAPGLFGSLVGLLWVYLLFWTGNFWLYVGGTIIGLAISVWLSGKAERILNQTDPGSIVLDEITAMPLCFSVVFGMAWFKQGELPRLHWAYDFLLLVLFRVFDVAKPWPIRRSQKLPGGWGVTVDDVLAATYVAILSAIPAFFQAHNHSTQ